MKRPLPAFVIGILIGLIVLAAISYLHSGLPGVICALASGIICLVPASLSMMLAIWGEKKSATEQLMAIFGGMILRMVVVLGCSVGLFLMVDWFKAEKSREYVYWANILVCYLFTLGLETALLVRDRRSGKETPGAAEVSN